MLFVEALKTMEKITVHLGAQKYKLRKYNHFLLYATLFFILAYISQYAYVTVPFAFILTFPVNEFDEMLWIYYSTKLKIFYFWN